MISNISNSNVFVSTLILRLKSKCNKTDATKKSFLKLLNAFFILDVNSKFSKKEKIFRFFQHINKRRSYAAELIDKLSIETDEIYQNLNVYIESLFQSDLKNLNFDEINFYLHCIH